LIYTYNGFEKTRCELVCCFLCCTRFACYSLTVLSRFIYYYISSLPPFGIFRFHARLLSWTTKSDRPGTPRISLSILLGLLEIAGKLLQAHREKTSDSTLTLLMRIAEHIPAMLRSRVKSHTYRGGSSTKSLTMPNMIQISTASTGDLASKTSLHGSALRDSWSSSWQLLRLWSFLCPRTRSESRTGRSRGKTSRPSPSQVRTNETVSPLSPTSFSTLRTRSRTWG